MSSADGNRRLLQKEGVAYTLAFGAPLVFVTPNLADTKQPLFLIVQGQEFRVEEELPAYREMVERLAQGPIGQARYATYACINYFESRMYSWAFR